MKKTIKAALLALCILNGAAFAASPLELTGGKLKLVLYPDSGSFSLFQLSDIGKNRYEPLFEDRNASATTWFSVLSNGRIFKLAKKSGKTVKMEETTGGAKFIFTLTDDFQVEQEFTFINSSASGTPVAVRIDTRVENTSGKDGTFALKALVDTTLGESEGIHFITNIKNRISAETMLKPDVDRDSVIVSKNKDLSLMIPLSGAGVTRPESTYIANWDRLNTLTWNPDFLEGRSFNTLYSINDSAVLLVWPEKNVRSNEKMLVSMVLGPYSEELLSGTSAIVRPAETVTKPVLSKDARNQAIKDILNRIAQIQANPASVSDDELTRLNSQLDILLKQGGEE